MKDEGHLLTDCPGEVGHSPTSGMQEYTDKRNRVTG